MDESSGILDRNLADSIAMLEQILEVMPHDSDALKALYNAYRRVGQQENAFQYLVQIVDVCVGGEHALLPFVQQELDSFAELLPGETVEQLGRLKEIGDQQASVSAEPEAVPVRKEADIGEELTLAWKLYEDSLLSQEEYSSVLHDLTEVSSQTLDVPVSVLHVLKDRGFAQMSRIMNYLSSRSGAPCIRLSDFELSEDVAQTLPLAYAVHEGALPFARMGRNLLVAVLNPFNNALIEQVETEFGHRCCTYLVDPEDYDQALGRLRDLVR